jgi:hypothetical protein
LGWFVDNALRFAEFDVGFVGQVIFVEFGQFFFNGKPGDGNPVVDVRLGSECLGDSLAQLVDVVTGKVGSVDAGLDGWVLEQ